MARKLELTTVIAAVIAAIGTIGAARLAYLANDNAIKASSAIELTRFELSNRDRQTDLDIKAYELVEKTLSGDAVFKKGHGIAAAAIVNALTKPPLRSELQNALRAGVTDPILIDAIDKATQFDLEEYSSQIAPKSDTRSQTNVRRNSNLFGNLSIYSSAWATGQSSLVNGQRIDIFYCEANSTTLTKSRRKSAEVAANDLAHVAPEAKV